MKPTFSKTLIADQSSETNKENIVYHFNCRIRMMFSIKDLVPEKPGVPKFPPMVMRRQSRNVSEEDLITL